MYVISIHGLLNIQIMDDLPIDNSFYTILLRINLNIVPINVSIIK